ncbi:fungal-specific transcription factor domain-containing protein [Cercophora newfieldiana]|uniref:Fungal-specific transcription factor domain-containing protein n=1 Tax=Cercophora newfieldiana TaxID=92897 RepID=A0AA39XWV3_9PEZI|nr:fungal-specific transcription factor domain-containing protein [Cercophora newfieldiana]
MKNKQKSRSGCRTCKLRRLRCDETKPSCRNCTQKNLECPGYQQRLQWSTKHERPWNATTSGPENFTQLVTAASEVISSAGEPSTVGVISLPSPRPRSDKSRDSGGSLVPFIKRDASPGDETNLYDVPDISVSQPVVNIPSFLIEHWFKSVCGSWSARDSHANPYRTLTHQLWSSSTPVFYALQAISAASLVERLPAVMRETARAAPTMATEAIRKELVDFFGGKTTRFPSELLLALFCMSSSMAWLESRELGLQYLRQARRVLKTLETWELEEEERQLFEFFSGCLIYEEMLRSVVSQDEVDLKNMLSWPEPPQQAALIKASPHPWSGVSSDVFRLFGKAVALCRRSRARWRHNAGTSFKVLQGAMKDIEDATLVEEALLAINTENVDVTELPGCDPDLHNTTEAYRLSSLLQLYESFPDLVTKRMPSLADADGETVWNNWVTPLALHITAILQQLPEANMRCIQPLICLSAGSGLRFESKLPMAAGHQSYLLNAEGGGKSPPSMSPPPSITSEPKPALLDPTVTPNSIKVSQARRFLMDRLEQLELSLPPKPIDVAKQLIRAVWSAYDEEIGTPRRTHWLDVMSNTGLHSIFG